MNDGGPRIPRATSNRDETRPQVTGAALYARDEWLQQLRPLDPVAVYCNGSRIQVATVTSAPRTFVTIGRHRDKASFRRRDGWYGNECSYQGERTGGVLKGCPRGPAPTPDSLTRYARQALERIDKEVLKR